MKAMPIPFTNKRGLFMRVIQRQFARKGKLIALKMLKPFGRNNNDIITRPEI
jgi:hypothetical protein